MKICWFFLTLALCSCRTSYSPVKLEDPKPEVLAAIAQAVDAAYVPKAVPIVLSQEQQGFLKTLTISDPLSLVHPRYYDRIECIELRQVERFYFNYTGDVSHSEVITLPEDEFWMPLNVLAQYYCRFSGFPMEPHLSVPILMGALSQKSKR